MSIRVITPASGAGSITVTAPGDPYNTQVTFNAGQVVSVDAGGPWESAIGTSNLTTLSGAQLTDDLEGESGQGTDNV